MATDRKNTDEENSQVSKKAGSIDSSQQFPHNSRLDYYSFIDLDPAGYPADLFDGAYVKDEKEMKLADICIIFVRQFFITARILEKNPSWNKLLNHYPIEGLDIVLPKSRYYSPDVSITEYIALAAFIYGIRYETDRSLAWFSRLDYVISLSAFLLTQRVFRVKYADTWDYDKSLLHLVLIIVEYFRMREEYSYHFHPSQIAKEGKDEAFFNNKRDKVFKENPEVKELWDCCIAVVGEPREVSLSEKLNACLFRPFYCSVLYPNNITSPQTYESLLGSWHQILIDPIVTIMEKHYAEDEYGVPYDGLFWVLVRRKMSFIEGITNERLLRLLKSNYNLSSAPLVHLIVFFQMCTIDDKRRHAVKYYMQDSTKSEIKDLEEICETILKYKNDSSIIFKEIDRFDNIHKFVKLLKTEYYLSHPDEEIEPDMVSFSAFDQPSEIHIAADFNDLPKDDEFLIENIIHTKGTYRCPFEITEPYYYGIDLDSSSCLGYFKGNFYGKNAAVDGNKRSIESRFSELVNWFAQNGVIKNEPAVLDLFAYRLTGLGEKPKELPKIEIPIKIDASHKEAYWTLIYLVKSLYAKNTTRNKDRLGRGVYPKLTKFFVVTDPKKPERADIIQHEFDDIVNSRIVDGKEKNPSALVEGKVPDSLINLIKNNFGLPDNS